MDAQPVTQTTDQTPPRESDGIRPTKLELEALMAMNTQSQSLVAEIKERAQTATTKFKFRRFRRPVEAN